MIKVKKMFMEARQAWFNGKLSELIRRYPREMKRGETVSGIIENYERLELVNEHQVSLDICRFDERTARLDGCDVVMRAYGDNRNAVRKAFSEFHKALQLPTTDCSAEHVSYMSRTLTEAA
jgi:putative NADH-flavin reductase